MFLIGQCIAKLHNGGVIHGDLTTSNILLKKNLDEYNLSANDLYFIDFGLSTISNSVEDKAVDLFVLGILSKKTKISEKTFICSHP